MYNIPIDVENDLFPTIIKSMEKDTGKKVFTLRLLAETEEGFLLVVVFTDKSVMSGEIIVKNEDDHLVVSVQANFI